MNSNIAPPCTDETHAAARADVAVWATLIYRGVWVFEGDDEEPETRSEVRNCPTCGSTLLREIT